MLDKIIDIITAILPFFGGRKKRQQMMQDVKEFSELVKQGERSITCTSYYSLYFFNPNDFISYFLVPSTRFPLSCHSQFDIALF